MTAPEIRKPERATQPPAASEAPFQPVQQGLQHGPVHLLKRNRSAAVVLSEQHYSQLQLQASRAPVAEASALQWLLALPPSTSPRSKAEIDAELAAERDW